MQPHEKSATKTVNIKATCTVLWLMVPIEIQPSFRAVGQKSHEVTDNKSSNKGALGTNFTLELYYLVVNIFSITYKLLWIFHEHKGAVIYNSIYTI